MFTDTVLPKNNEAEFIEIALKLGFKKLYFLYDFDKYQNQKSRIFDFDIEIGFLVNQKNLNHAIKSSKLLVVKSSERDRFFIESKKIKIIYGFEEINRKDSLHQRVSGLNHIICELAKKNDVAVGFSYSSLFNKNNEVTALLIGRMMQNIKLCQKYKVKMVIGSFSNNPFGLRAPHDVMSLFAMMGVGQEEIKESLTSTSN